MQYLGHDTNRVSHSVMSDSATPWTVACQAPLSMGFSGQEYWSEKLFSSPGLFLTQGSSMGLPHFGQLLDCLSHKGSPFGTHLY